ncbi:hypothetical protein pipiens_017205 [Culex pipiens pipiens]|uniref:Uncharacterized protein n=1 Tax=Culex pipiens pipiens TaxID=38569 RepID=A0ABD1CHM8_CULPP
MQGSEFRGYRLSVHHSTQPIVKPEAKSNEAAQKEIEEAMSIVKEAQSMISAAIDPVIGMLSKDNKSSSRHRSRTSRSRSRKRSTSRSRSSRSTKETSSRSSKKDRKSRSPDKRLKKILEESVSRDYDAEERIGGEEDKVVSPPRSGSSGRFDTGPASSGTTGRS